jgi:hypothetical protein
MIPAMRRALLSAALLAAAAPAAGEGDGRIVERVVAVVRTPVATQPRVITLTRLEEETRIALVARGATGAAEGELDGPALRAGLRWLVDQILLHDEAVRLQVFEVARAELTEELRRFQGHFAEPEAYRAFLARCDLTEEELLVVLRRSLRVQRYVESRVSGALRVKEADVDRWLAERGEDGRASPAVRGAVRTRLAEERSAREVQALVAELRGRAQVRVMEGFEGGAE